MQIQRASIIRIVAGTVLILLVPLIAMQFTNQVAWGLADFAFAGALLIGASLIFELAKIKFNPKYHLAIAILFVVALLLVWVELAVGIWS